MELFEKSGGEDAVPGCPGCPTPEKFQKSIQLHKLSPNKFAQKNSRLWAPVSPIFKITFL